MKRTYLVKGDERHEVELVDGRYNFCALGHMITPAVAVLLGYELEEVVERDECWIVVDRDGGSKGFVAKDKAERYAKHCVGATVEHMVELKYYERIFSRDDLERAYSLCGYETKGNIVFYKLCRELGFVEGER